MDNQAVIDIAKHYNIHPEKLEILRNNERILVRIEADRTYFLKGEKAEKSYWEACCTFANYLLGQGMNVTQYQKSAAGHYVSQLDNKIFTLEYGLSGDPIKIITGRELSEIGRLLGLQHRLSMQIPSPFSTATSWSMFGGNQTDAIGDYDENELSFLEFKDHYQHSPIYSKIKVLYKEYRQNLQQIWGQLPQGPVQGDFCYYNILKNPDRTLWLYDFNLAGNEVYLNECLGVAVYHAWHVPYEGNLSEEERFQLFLESYVKERPWTPLEQAVAPKLKAIIQAFRYDRIEEGITLKTQDEQHQFLQETLNILEKRQQHK